MKEVIKQNRYFLIPYVSFLLAGVIALIISNSKADLHITINRYHNSFFDTFFYYATFLGDGITATLVAVMLLVVKFRSFFVVAVSNLFSASITQLLKHTVFSDVNRPKKFFEGVHDLYFVPGVENYLYNSFPSGHSTCAFALYFSLTMLVKNNKLKFLFFGIAFLAGFSRIYLSQHFLQDVLAGSFIGMISAFIFYILFDKSERPFMDKSLITIFRN